MDAMETHFHSSDEMGRLEMEVIKIELKQDFTLCAALHLLSLRPDSKSFL